MTLYDKFINNTPLFKEDFKGFDIVLDNHIRQDRYEEFLYIYAFIKPYIPLTARNVNMIKQELIQWFNQYNYDLKYCVPYSKAAFTFLKDSLTVPLVSFLTMCNFTEQEEKDFLLDNLNLIKKDHIINNNITHFLPYHIRYSSNRDFVRTDAFKFMVQIS